MRIGFTVLACLASSAIACATAPPHEYEIADGWRGAPSVERVLLAPMNATANVAEELQPGADRAFERVKAHLVANGLAVEEAPLFRFRTAWSRAFEGVVVDPEKPRDVVPVQAITNLAEDLSVHHEFDVLVLPGIELRPTRLRGRTARWDGVRRRMVDERTAFDWHGNPAAASLRVHVYTKDGKRVFDGIGGLDMIFKYTGGNRMTIVDDPLSDLEHLDEGVRIAFDPLIPFAQ